MVGHGLADHLATLALRLGALTDNVLLLMAAHSGLCHLGVDVLRGFERYAGIVGAILILALLTGFAFGVFHHLKGGFRLLRLNAGEIFQFFRALHTVELSL